MTTLDTFLTTHEHTLRSLLGYWPVNVWETKQYGPLTKYTLGEMPDGRWAMLHHLTAPDEGLPHDHPCRMETHVLQGGYFELVYPAPGEVEEVVWPVGSTHHIEPECIHKIIYLPEGESWTLVFAGPVVREWRHYSEEELKNLAA